MKYTTLIEYGDTVHQSVNIVEVEEPVSFSASRFNFGAFYLKFPEITDPATGKSYSTFSDIETLVTFKATAPGIDPETGERIRLELDVHKCTGKEEFFENDLERFASYADSAWDWDNKDFDKYCVSGLEQSYLSAEK